MDGVEPALSYIFHPLGPLTVGLTPEHIRAVLAYAAEIEHG
jgi:hypothetical protein